MRFSTQSLFHETEETLHSHSQDQAMGLRNHLSTIRLLPVGRNSFKTMPETRKCERLLTHRTKGVYTQEVEGELISVFP